MYFCTRKKKRDPKQPIKKSDSLEAGRQGKSAIESLQASLEKNQDQQKAFCNPTFSIIQTGSSTPKTTSGSFLFNVYAPTSPYLEPAKLARTDNR